MIQASLVIPCYNEGQSLALLIERCRKLVEASDCEVILVDNGSTDTTPEILGDLVAGPGRLRTIRVDRNRGYGHGVLSGLAAARGALLGWTHADLQTDPLDAARGFALFGGTESKLFVKGRRLERPIGDRIFTVGMAAFETMIFGRVLWDINAQPTLFGRSFYESWKSPPEDFALDLYAYHKAKQSGLAVRRVDVRFPERRYGRSHWNVDWRAKARFIKRTLNYSIQLRLAGG